MRDFKCISFEGSRYYVLLQNKPSPILPAKNNNSFYFSQLWVSRVQLTSSSALPGFVGSFIKLHSPPHWCDWIHWGVDESFQQLYLHFHQSHYHHNHHRQDNHILHPTITRPTSLPPPLPLSITPPSPLPPPLLLKHQSKSHVWSGGWLPASSKSNWWTRVHTGSHLARLIQQRQLHPLPGGRLPALG